MLELLTTDFFLYALVAGLSLALVAGPLGSFIVWRQMSYFGDTLAHAALLGIAIGIITNSNPQLAIIVSSLIFAVLLGILDRKPTLATDALLGILAHSTLALGIVVLTLTDSIRIDLEAYLFGALLTISPADLRWVVLVSLLVGAMLAINWNKLLAATVHAELAQIEGSNVARLNLTLMILIALTIAVAMKIVGVLLITSLLIIPPAAARRLANTPEQMALFASMLGCMSVVIGLLFAFYANVPVGPAIVVIATAAFFTLFLLPGRQKSG